MYRSNADTNVERHGSSTWIFYPACLESAAVFCHWIPVGTQIQTVCPWISHVLISSYVDSVSRGHLNECQEDTSFIFTGTSWKSSIAHANKVTPVMDNSAKMRVKTR